MCRAAPVSVWWLTEHQPPRFWQSQRCKKTRSRARAAHSDGLQNSANWQENPYLEWAAPCSGNSQLLKGKGVPVSTGSWSITHKDWTHLLGAQLVQHLPPALYLHKWLYASHTAPFSSLPLWWQLCFRKDLISAILPWKKIEAIGESVANTLKTSPNK